MAGSSSNRLAVDLFGGGSGQRLDLSPLELFRRTPKEEIEAYSIKLFQSEGFDVSDFPNAVVYGTVRPLLNLCGDELKLVTELAKSALADYNQKQKNQDNSYEFVKVVMANSSMVCGTWYYITFLVVKQQRTSCYDSADDASRPHETFQAKVFYHGFGPVVDVELCRPKPTHPLSLSGFDSQTPHEARLSKEDSRLYYGMLAESEGFDVPDIPNSSEVPRLFRPIKIKSLDTDNLNKVINSCKLCTERYNRSKQENYRFEKFLKGNKRAGPYSEYYNIEFLVKRKKGKYQTLQAKILWDKRGNPSVELLREKPGEEGRNV